MSITDELNELIALHGNCRDALNVTLAKLRQVQDEIAVLKEAAQQGVQADGACTCPRFESNGTKVFPMRECDGCRETANR